MNKSSFYITLINIKPDSLSVGEVVRLVKEPSNSHDLEAIAIYQKNPFSSHNYEIEPIAYVANSTTTVAHGTSSAGRIYDKFEFDTKAKVLFLIGKVAVAKLLLQIEQHEEDKIVSKLKTKFITNKILKKQSQREENYTLREATKIFLENEKASTSLLQRKMRIGYAKASDIVEKLESLGIIGPRLGTKPSNLLIETLDEFDHLIKPRSEENSNHFY